MEQYNEVVFKHREGYKHVVSNAENGDLIVKTVPILLEGDVDKAEYFVKISEEDRKKVAEWFKKQEQEAGYNCQSVFLKNVERAIKTIDYDYWVATIEPSVRNGKIYYKEGEKVGVGFECREWRKMAIDYYPERGSRLGENPELAMWYALRIIEADDWTLEYVTQDSSSAGNWHNSPGASREMEMTGARVCGGYKDGQGNSYKIVIVDDYSFALVGGDFYDDGRKRPVAALVSGWEPPEAKNWGTGVVVLTK